MATIFARMNPFSIDKNPTDLLKDHANRIRTLRKEYKMSQSELARRANVSLGSYKRFESNYYLKLTNHPVCRQERNHQLSITNNQSRINSRFNAPLFFLTKTFF